MTLDHLGWVIGTKFIAFLPDRALSGNKIVIVYGMLNKHT